MLLLLLPEPLYCKNSVVSSSRGVVGTVDCAQDLYPNGLGSNPTSHLLGDKNFTDLSNRFSVIAFVHYQPYT